MIIAVAGGKGGTGKTTVALGLADAASEPVHLMDCDAEAPNCHLFGARDPSAVEAVYSLAPELDPERCTSCGKCHEVCRFSALVCMNAPPLIFPEMCHGCGACLRVCPEHALTGTQRLIGEVEHREDESFTLTTGRLRVGEAMSPPVIRAAKRSIDVNILTIIDAPPGVSCPAMAAIRGCDYLVLVTEPTPFGLHDFRLVADAAWQLRLHCGVVVNRDGLGDANIDGFCQEQNLPILGRIPNSREVAAAYSRGEIPSRALPELGERFTGILQRIREEVVR